MRTAALALLLVSGCGGSAVVAATAAVDEAAERVEQKIEDEHAAMRLTDEQAGAQLDCLRAVQDQVLTELAAELE